MTRQPTPGVYENYREPGEFGEGVTVRRADSLSFDDEVIAYAQELIDDRAAHGCKVYVSDVLDALRAALEANR